MTKSDIHHNTILYQICIEGMFLNFDGKKAYSSKKVFLNKPNENDINEFIAKCCNNKHPKNLYDLDINTIKINIDELEVS